MSLRRDNRFGDMHRRSGCPSCPAIWEEYPKQELPQEFSDGDAAWNSLVPRGGLHCDVRQPESGIRCGADFPETFPHKPWDCQTLPELRSELLSLRSTRRLRCALRAFRAHRHLLTP